MKSPGGDGAGADIVGSSKYSTQGILYLLTWLLQCNVGLT